MENIFYLNGNVENVAFQPIVFDCKRLELAGFTENITLSLSVSFLYDPHLYSLHVNAKAEMSNLYSKLQNQIKYPESLSGQCGGRLNVRNGG